MIADKQYTQRWLWVWGAICAFLVFAGLLGYIAWRIVGSNQGTAGASPGLAVAGELADPRMRSMEQWCTGVIKTRSDVWLVGLNELRSSVDEPVSYVPADAIRLGEREGAVSRSGGLFSRSRYLTTLARLQDDGRFEVVATVPDIACLTVTPESEHLYLFTWLPRPSKQDDRPGSDTNRQDMVFRSLDQGRSWQWVEAGFMADVMQRGSSLRPVFVSDQEAWLWGSDPQRRPAAWPSGPATAAPADIPEQHPTALVYSPDAGLTSQRIHSPQALLASDEELQAMIGIREGDGFRRSSGDTERHVVQVDDTRAYAWVSESMWYWNAQDESWPIMLTTRVELVRPDSHAPWQVAQVQREPGTFLAHVKTSADGRSHAVLSNDEGQWLVQLDPSTGAWIGHQPMPRLLPEWLASSRMGVRYFWSNGAHQVISLWGDIILPRALFPFLEEPAEINTDAHFHTRDGGRTWQQLAIPGYLGVMGLARHDSEMFWTKGDWYSNDEPYVWRYDLAE